MSYKKDGVRCSEFVFEVGEGGQVVFDPSDLSYDVRRYARFNDIGELSNVSGEDAVSVELWNKYMINLSKFMVGIQEEAAEKLSTWSKQTPEIQTLIPRPKLVFDVSMIEYIESTFLNPKT